MTETRPPSVPGPDRDDEDPGTPRWVYALGAVALLLIVLFVILHLTGASPAGHTPS